MGSLQTEGTPFSVYHYFRVPVQIVVHTYPSRAVYALYLARSYRAGR